jgi:hypothetical protein
MSKTRTPLKLKLKRGQLHKDLAKAPSARLTDADLAEEHAKGGVYALRAQFAENIRLWKHAPAKR